MNTLIRLLGSVLVGSSKAAQAGLRASAGASRAGRWIFKLDSQVLLFIIGTLIAVGLATPTVILPTVTSLFHHGEVASIQLHSASIANETHLEVELRRFKDQHLILTLTLPPGVDLSPGPRSEEGGLGPATATGNDGVYVWNKIIPGNDDAVYQLILALSPGAVSGQVVTGDAKLQLRLASGDTLPTGDSTLVAQEPLTIDSKPPITLYADLKDSSGQVIQSSVPVDHLDGITTEIHIENDGTQPLTNISVASTVREGDNLQDLGSQTVLDFGASLTQGSGLLPAASYAVSMFTTDPITVTPRWDQAKLPAGATIQGDGSLSIPEIAPGDAYQVDLPIDVQRSGDAAVNPIPGLTVSAGVSLDGNTYGATVTGDSFKPVQFQMSFASPIDLQQPDIGVQLHRETGGTRLTAMIRMLGGAQVSASAFVVHPDGTYLRYVPGTTSYSIGGQPVGNVQDNNEVSVFMCRLSSLSLLRAHTTETYYLTFDLASGPPPVEFAGEPNPHPWVDMLLQRNGQVVNDPAAATFKSGDTLTLQLGAEPGAFGSTLVNAMLDLEVVNRASTVDLLGLLTDGRSSESGFRRMSLNISNSHQLTYVQDSTFSWNRDTGWLKQTDESGTSPLLAGGETIANLTDCRDDAHIAVQWYDLNFKIN